MVKALVAFLVAVGVLAAAYFAFVWHWSYSSGERAGWVQKFSKKGWVCKTWEGELALVSLPGSSVEKFYFTIHDETVADQVTKMIGKRVALHYEEKVGLPTTCFGDTRHFVTKVTEAADIPLGPGVSLQGPGAAAPAAGNPATPTMQAPPQAAPLPPAPALPQAPAAPASR